MRTFLVLLTLLYTLGSMAQWQGEVKKFQIFEDSIQLYDTIAGNAYLFYPSAIVDSAQWDFSVHLDFNPSASNYAMVYLKSELSNLQGNGYFVKLGGAEDEISLYRQDGSKDAISKIIDGIDDRLDLSDVEVNISVRYTNGLWQLYSQLNDEEYDTEGEVVDSSYYRSSYFGLYANYTRTRAQLMSFSNFVWDGIAYQDTDAPSLDSLKILTKNRLLFYFNELIDSATFSYLQNPANAIRIDSNTIEVDYAQGFPLRDTFTVQYTVLDSVGNMASGDANAYYTPFEVIFVEMLSVDSLYFELNRSPLEIVPSNISINQSIPHAIEAYSKGYVALFDSPLPARTIGQLSILNILDENGDSLQHYEEEIAYIIPQFQDILFTEVMPDPIPAIDSLPEEEYIEIFNATPFTINLENWYLQRDDNTYNFPQYEIAPFTYVLLCDASIDTLFSSDINILGITSFPALLNTEMELYLKSEGGVLVDYINYNTSWHLDDFHADGGFSLERIDLQNPSMYNNWTSSCNLQGGTPGRSNCVEAYNPDTIPPVFTNVYALDQQWLHLQLKEAIYRENITDLAYFNLPDFSINTIIPIGESEFIDAFMLGTDRPIDKFKVYDLHVQGISDLSGNMMIDTVFPVAVCASADSADILFSEVMFDPRDEGVEYIELYNNSEYPLDLSQYVLAQVDDDQLWSKSYLLAEQTSLFLPQTYLVLTKDKASFNKQYTSVDSTIELALPALNNIEGKWGLLNKSAQVIDRMHYNDNYHSVLLDSHQGVALERVSFFASGELASNWQSASSLANYATPGARNSIQEKPINIESETVISPQSFTPDGDGIDDRVRITIDNKYAGSSVRVRIYNQRGIVVRELLENDLIGSYPVLYWDGTKSNGERCAMGPYIIYIEIITPENQVHHDRLELILSAKTR